MRSLFQVLFRSVHAAEQWQGTVGDVATFRSLETLLANVIRAVASFVGIVLFIMLLVGGFNFLFSGGDAKKLESARGTITNALVGLIVIIAAYLILKTIEQLTGANVTQVEFPMQ